MSGAAKSLDNGFERQFRNIAMNSIGVWTKTVYMQVYKKGRSPRLKFKDAAALKEGFQVFSLLLQEM